MPKATPHGIVLVPILALQDNADALPARVRHWFSGSDGTSFAERSHEKASTKFSDGIDDGGGGGIWGSG